MTTRMTLDEYGLSLARAAAGRADCTRRQVGAVIVAADGSIVSTGYNGLASGRPGCLTAGACPRGQLSYDEQPADVAYEQTGCRAVHAEANAIMRAGRDRCVGATIYVSETPCFGCSVLIEGAGLARTVTPETETIEVFVAESYEPVAVIDVPPASAAQIPVFTRIEPGTPPALGAQPAVNDSLTTDEHGWTPAQQVNIAALRRAEARRADLAREHPGWRP